MSVSSKLEIIITARKKDLGGFTVRRVLPYSTHRMVGPFIFFDHMGPAEFAPGQGIDVRPHPHINLATVTYLFEGKITHRDSLGSLPRFKYQEGEVKLLLGSAFGEVSPVPVQSKLFYAEVILKKGSEFHIPAEGLSPAMTQNSFRYRMTPPTPKINQSFRE